jgi:hypothetical protein
LPARGATTDYLAGRIARDAPEVFERMKAGEFKSVPGRQPGSQVLAPGDREEVLRV